jgi:hypothetical protein
MKLKDFLEKYKDILNSDCKDNFIRNHINTSLRVTHPDIVELMPNEVFTFGSNEGGKHGKGAARTAMRWGAIYGRAFGLQGRTFAIPTVNESISDKLPIETIKCYVNKFIEFAKEHPELLFSVTEIGCGLAGHKREDIAPLFSKCYEIQNISLPMEFWKIILEKE